MTPLEWTARPREEANLLNPVFLAMLATRAAVGHRELRAEGLPWPLIFLALPAVLHRETREAMPRDVRGDMAGWTRTHPLLVAGLADRATALRPFIREALLFGFAHGLVRHEGRRLEPGTNNKRSASLSLRQPTDDFSACAQRATFFGRWCASSGTPATVFALWGIRP